MRAESELTLQRKTDELAWHESEELQLAQQMRECHAALEASQLG